MLQLDPDDPDDEENNKVLTALSTGAPSATTIMPGATAGAQVLTETDQVTLSNYKVIKNLYLFPLLAFISRIVFLIDVENGALKKDTADTLVRESG